MEEDRHKMEFNDLRYYLILIVNGLLNIHLLLFLGLVFAINGFSQTSNKFSAYSHIHYGDTYFTESQDEKIDGRIGYGIGVKYHFFNEAEWFRYSIGIEYSKVGNSRNFIWDDATPEREARYGKFPISYAMWYDVHYISFPFSVDFTMWNTWITGTSLSLDYPIGTGYFSERKSADGLVVETNKDAFDTTKGYPFNTSIGWGIHLGNSLQLNESLSLILKVKFKIYTLLAFRSNDYFPHEEWERPFTTGISIGFSF